MSAPVLSTEGLGVAYGRFQAVQDVSVTFTGPGVHSVIGPNGAGKTTFFNALSGVVRPSSGRIHAMGRDVTRLLPSRRLAGGMARSFQITSLFEEETVRENIRLAVQAKRGRRLAFMRGSDSDSDTAERTARLLARFGLERQADTAVAELPHGLKRIVDIALCVAGEARIILLDEPTSGIGIDDVPRIRAIIRELGEEQLVILIEHNMNVVLEISRSVSVLVRGRLLVSGTPDEVQANRDVQAAYLGTKRHARA